MNLGFRIRPVSHPTGSSPGFWGLTGYQWTVVFAAWLGWGFDVFDGLLFNFVAPNCIPTLLGLPLGSPQARSATFAWTGILTSLLLLGWALGGTLFGKVADRIGRTRTLMLTMLLYSVGTALCAFAPNVWLLALFRLIASLGIGGEWAAGASMVAEVVPEKRRIEAGALLYTSAPFGLALATLVNYVIAGQLFAGQPEVSWRYVFLSGLIPAAVALAVRYFVKEPERWAATARNMRPPTVGELFTPAIRPLTISGLITALTALVAWWSCNAFIPIIGSGLAEAEAHVRGLDTAARLALSESWKAQTTNWFNLGGLIGTLLTVPASKLMGRRPMFGLYFLVAGLSMLIAFGFDMRPEDADPDVLPHGAQCVRRLRQLHLLPAGALPDAPAGHRVGLLLQHRPGRSGRRPISRGVDRRTRRLRARHRARHPVLGGVRSIRRYHRAQVGG